MALFGYAHVSTFMIIGRKGNPAQSLILPNMSTDIFFSDFRGWLKESMSNKIYCTCNFNPEGSNHLLRMVMEPGYLPEEVIVHPNHHLTR